RRSSAARARSGVDEWVARERRAMRVLAMPPLEPEEVEGLVRLLERDHRADVHRDHPVRAVEVDDAFAHLALDDDGLARPDHAADEGEALLEAVVGLADDPLDLARADGQDPPARRALRRGGARRGPGPDAARELRLLDVADAEHVLGRGRRTGVGEEDVVEDALRDDLPVDLHLHAAEARGLEPPLERGRERLLDVLAPARAE